jgi:radical SAM superfamily enzyme YgiQ (UPF0313 family)
MKKLKVCFIQPNFKQGPGGIASYLPYSCGLLWSYARKDKVIKDNYIAHRFIYKREPIKELADELSKVDVLGFSTYVWNRNYNFTLAKEIKKLNPNCLIIFGGPEPPVERDDIFSSIMPFADIVVKGEGEISFRDILKARVLGTPYFDINGLLINQDSFIINTGNSTRISDLDEIPSPYLEGIFDDIMSLEKEWNGTLETNRGCPYQCTFCDWGSLTYSKMKKFDIDRVFDEIHWMGVNKIGYLDVADSNFGIFLKRDEDIVDKLIEVQKKTGFPYRTGWSWAKNQKSEVVSIAKKLIESGHFNNGLTISLQSLSEDTLTAIKRNNMDVNKISHIFQDCVKNGIPLNVELIIGLPGETLKSWEKTLFGVLEVGQHDSIEAWQAQILENSEMNLVQRKTHNMRGQFVTDYFPNEEGNVATEFSEIVTSTSTMGIDEMIEAYKWTWFLITWHTGGFSQYVARFLRKYRNEPYENFYKKFRKFLQKDEFWKSEEISITNDLKNWYESGKRIERDIHPIKVTAVTNQYRTIFKIHSNNTYEYMYEKLREFVKIYNLPMNIEDDLFSINNSVVAKQRNIKNFELDINFNVLDYITNSVCELERNKTKLSVTYPHDIDKSKDLAWFLESIFFARRRSFGKNFIKNECK